MDESQQYRQQRLEERSGKIPQELLYFFYAWCCKNKTDPVYKFFWPVESKYRVEVKIGKNALGGFIGCGIDSIQTIARIHAVEDICSKLIQADLMTQEEFHSLEPNGRKITFPTNETKTSQKSSDETNGEGKKKSEGRNVKEEAADDRDSLVSAADSNRRGGKKREFKTESNVDPPPRKRPKTESISAQQSTIANAQVQPPYAPVPPRNDIDDGDWQQRVDADIWEHYRRNKQTADIFQWKMSVLDEISTRIQRTMRDPFRLFAVGSTINGLGSFNSDMDLCLVIFSRDEQGRECIKECPNFSKSTLYKLSRSLPYQSTSIRNIQVIPARVPIIKFDYVQGEHSLEIDMNVNNLMGIRNSHLMHHYSLLDERFPAMALLVKHWAIMAGINDAVSGTLGSYALILMVIHYLQYGMTRILFSFSNIKEQQRPILPSLQGLYPQMFNDHSDVRSLCLHTRVDYAQNDDPRLNLAELLLGFFKYYRDFHFARKVISIRCGNTYERDQTKAVKWIWIEEPYQGDNVARSVCLREKYDRILAAFEEGYDRLKKGKSLKAIGVTLL